MKKGINLLDMSKLLKMHPDLFDFFYGDAAKVGEMIFAKRMDLGWTQRELASKANIDFQTITLIEGGSVMLSENVYKKLYKVLAITMEEQEEWLHILFNESPNWNI